MGRPTKYNKALAAKICERLAEGESLRAICKDGDMPSRSNVFRWLMSDSQVYSGFRDQYALARQVQAECLFDDINEIADNEASSQLFIDGEMALDEDGKPIMVPDMVSINHARLRIDSRKWTVSKLLPKKYGDKIEGSGSDESSQPIGKVQIEVVGANIKD